MTSKPTKNKVKPQTLKGFRDFLPQEQRLRNYVLAVFKEVFESFGFEPLETPSIEPTATLLGKYGSEADKLVYTFSDKGSRNVGLIYDLTVPISKVLALNIGNKITLPFKRYQIQRVWRADKPQKGRYREILMCDIDTFGVSSPLADAEIIAIIYTILKKLQIENFKIKINSRQVLFSILKGIGITEEKFGLSVLQTIDKLNKIGQDKVNKELEKKGLDNNKIKTLWEFIKRAKPDEKLSEMIGFIESFGINLKYYQFDPTMARGLDYYTGPIFETVVQEPKIGSITGGGRYDKLISLLGGPDIPATGTTIGLDRICDCLKELNLVPPTIKTGPSTLVTVFPGYTDQSIKLAESLRQESINCELFLEETALDKQLKYANRKGIPYIAFLGPDEVKGQKVKLKTMQTGKQETLSLQELIKKLKSKSGS
jgi:histidyl-tRNA synthetase